MKLEPLKRVPEVAAVHAPPDFTAAPGAHRHPALAPLAPGPFSTRASAENTRAGGGEARTGGKAPVTRTRSMDADAGADALLAPLQRRVLARLKSDSRDACAGGAPPFGTAAPFPLDSEAAGERPMGTHRGTRRTRGAAGDSRPCTGTADDRGPVAPSGQSRG